MFRGHSIYKHTFLGIFPSFIARKTTPQVKELYLNAAVLDLAVAMILFFEPIYLYMQGLSLQQIILFYLGGYILYFFLLPAGGKFVARFGIVKSIIVGSPFLIMYYLCLALLPVSHAVLLPAMIIFALQKIFYWPAFHLDFITYGIEDEQGKEVGNATAVMLGAFILGPLLGGVILNFFGFSVLFVIVSILIILSNFPLLLTKQQVSAENFSYTRAVKRLVEKKRVRQLLVYVGFGEELILLALWPVYIFIILNNTVSAGALVALSTLITSLTVLYVGKIVDTRHKGEVLRLTTVMYSFVWLIRIFAKTSMGVFFIDSFSRISKSSLSVPFTTITYHNARQGNVLENILFFEMALAAGKVLAAGIIAVLSVFIPQEYYWTVVFILASFFSLLYSLLKETGSLSSHVYFKR